MEQKIFSCEEDILRNNVFQDSSGKMQKEDLFQQISKQESDF